MIAVVTWNIDVLTVMWRWGAGRRVEYLGVEHDASHRLYNGFVGVTYQHAALVHKIIITTIQHGISMYLWTQDGSVA